MISPNMNADNSNILIPYLCRFQLLIQQLQAQLYFPSSFRISWKTKDDDQLACTQGFVVKSNLNVAKFQQTLQAQTIMLYNPFTKSYIDKDTYIVVSYHLNSRPNQVKELGKITLKMNSFMKDIDHESMSKETTKSDQNTVQNGRGFFSSKENTNNSGSWLKRASIQKIRPVNEMRCLRLQGGQYLAKLKFRCQLVESLISKLPLASISPQQFNQPIDSFVDEPRYLLGDDMKPTIVPLSHTIRESQKQLPKKQLNPSLVTPPLQNISGYSTTQQQQLKQSTHSQGTKQSIQQSLLNPTQSINTKTQHDQKFVSQIQYLQKQNSTLHKTCEEQKALILQQEQTIKQLKNDIYSLEDELKEKEVYLENNLEKLEKLDEYKYDLIELKDYTSKLQERLTQIYNQKPQTLRRLFKSVTGVRDSLTNKPQSSLVKPEGTMLIKPSALNKKVSMSDSFVKMSSITLIDQSCNLNSNKGMSQSVTQLRPLTNREHKLSQNQTHKSIPEPLFMASSSEIQLTNSELRQIQGSTVRMQNELSFMQMELYEVKANVQFQQEKYEAECINHSQTKMELFGVQEKLKSLEKAIKQITKEKESLVKEVEPLRKQMNRLAEENEQLHNQLETLEQSERHAKKQAFMLRESKQEQQYQLSITIKQQKIQLQSIKQNLTKSKHHQQSLQLLIASTKQILNQQCQQLLNIKSQLSEQTSKNLSLKQQVSQLKTKQQQVREYLAGLEGEIAEVHHIVEEKENNQEEMSKLILEREEIIEKREEEIVRLQEAIKGLEMKLDITEKQLALQRIKSQSLPNQQQSPSTIKTSSQKSPRDSQQLKLTLLQTSNNQLIKKNKQLISIVNKNATSLINYEKQKKQLMQLKEIQKEVDEMRKENVKLKEENAKLVKEQEKAIASIAYHTSKHEKEKTQIIQQKHQLTQLLSKQQLTSQQLYQSNLKLNQQLLSLQSSIQEKQHKISQTQLKLNKSLKEKKLYQDTQKILQAKVKNYQTLLMQKEQMITQKDSMIKELSSKLKVYEASQLKNNSLKSSPYRDLPIEEVSQIKIQSQINDSRNTQNNNNNKAIKRQSSRKDSPKEQGSIKRKQSIPQSLHNESSYLISPLSQTDEQRKKRQDAFKVGQNMIENTKKKQGDSQKAHLLIKMIQSYLDTKASDKYKNDVMKGIERLREFRLRDQNSSQKKTQAIEQIISKGQQIVKQLSKYKTKLLKDNRSKPKSVVDSLIEPIKLIEKRLYQLTSLIENFQKYVHSQ